MRVALVSPYSWTYPGGVNRHVAALARELREAGDEVSVLAPWDPPDRLSRVLHRRPADRTSPPEGFTRLGRTVAIPANGAVSNLCVWPGGVLTMRRVLRSGRFDVIHVHEPIAPLIGWLVPFLEGTPVVGTFHAYSTRGLPNRIARLLGGRVALNRLQARIAVSEAAEWTGRSWFGGRYRTIPNGVDLSLAPAGPKPQSDELRIVFVDGLDGVLIPPGDPQRLGEALRDLALDRDRLAAMGRAARASAERYAWPRVAREVRDVYQQLREQVPADGPPARPQRLPPLDPPPARRAQRSRRLARKLGVGVAWVAGVGLAALALHHLGIHRVIADIAGSSPSWLVVSLVLMAAAMLLRAVSWQAIVRAALPGRPVRFPAVASATMIGVLVSTAFPGRLGEPARAMVLARRLGRVRETLPVLVGSIVSQTLLNLLALLLLALTVLLTSRLLQGRAMVLAVLFLLPGALVVVVLLAPRLMPGRRGGRLGRALAALRRILLSVRAGLSVFRQRRRALAAVAAQLAAWAVQVVSAYTVMVALGLDDQVGLAAAATALFAVNVTAVVPVTPANIGVFQVAVAAVLTTGYGVSAGSALVYGILLQAVEVVTAVSLGVPAMVREGLTWSDLRLQALRAVELAPRKDPVRAR